MVDEHSIVQTLTLYIGNSHAFSFKILLEILLQKYQQLKCQIIVWFVSLYFTCLKTSNILLNPLDTIDFVNHNNSLYQTVICIQACYTHNEIYIYHYSVPSYSHLQIVVNSSTIVPVS